MISRGFCEVIYTQSMADGMNVVEALRMLVDRSLVVTATDPNELVHEPTPPRDRLAAPRSCFTKPRFPR
jgi:hypothetical protein